ncbi:MAG: hypothetical protein R3B41_00610 [Candidatus Doudnabacteria bacterium]
MDAIKGLKYALILVLATSVVLLGWTTYLRRSLDNKVAKFQASMGQAKSEAEAKEVIKKFMADIDFDPIAQSASADNYPCDWLCEVDNGGATQRTLPNR